MTKTELLRAGDIVQLGPHCKNRAFAACLMVVTEVKSWGAIGYVQETGEHRDEPGGQFYYRAEWEEMERTEGKVVWSPQL